MVVYSGYLSIYLALVECSGIYSGGHDYTKYEENVRWLELPN